MGKIACIFNSQGDVVQLGLPRHDSSVYPIKSNLDLQHATTRTHPSKSDRLSDLPTATEEMR